MRKIAILGSTGSIGTQALEVIKNNPEKFEVEILTANNNADLLIEQAIDYLPDSVVIANTEKYKYVLDSLKKYPIKVFTGYDSISQIVKSDNIDTVLTALVGFSGLIPTISAIDSGKNIALANKETLVVAGDLINNLVEKRKAGIVPVDSEHSAIFQCLLGEDFNKIEKVYLTASGGPFRGKDLNFLKKVTKKDSLNHPNWNMGEKVTIDSATLMNKGFEAIEAKWLFGLRPDQISVLIHPQSIIHSLVQFVDGSIKAQMGMPDMKIPIQYALSYPDRLKSDFARLDFEKYSSLTFEQPDLEIFRNLALSFEALEKGGNLPCILNAANEVVVKAFLSEEITFLSMPDIIEKAMNAINFIKNPSLEDYIETDKITRIYTSNLIYNN
jgi:1-deoxy-D-xylulose-5-phosphate reductoisomerase